MWGDEYPDVEHEARILKMKPKPKKVAKVYRLYVWTTRLYLGGPQRERGRCIGEFSHYKDLVAEAQRRAVAAGYAKSNWFQLYDWNQS